VVIGPESRNPSGDVDCGILFQTWSIRPIAYYSIARVELKTRRGRPLERSVPNRDIADTEYPQRAGCMQLQELPIAGQY
jgi:hypothetical protein